MFALAAIFGALLCAGLGIFSVISSKQLGTLEYLMLTAGLFLIGNWELQRLNTAAKDRAKLLKPNDVTL